MCEQVLFISVFLGHQRTSCILIYDPRQVSVLRNSERLGTINDDGGDMFITQANSNKLSRSRTSMNRHLN